MKDRQAEAEPAAVSERAKQAGEARARWPWAEPSVWTEQMLTSLEQGVKGGKWYSLMDKVYSMRNLRAAFERVKQNKGSAGVDHQTIERFERDLDGNLERLHGSLKEGNYQPQAIKRSWIPKPGSSEKRPLGIPSVRDRVAQTALRNVLEPIYERDFAEHSYGFRPGRGCKDALRRVWRLLNAGYTHVVDADIKGYFDSIPHNRLLARVEAKVADGRVIELIRAYLEQDIMETARSWTPEQGTPQGAVISPLLSNIYLDPLDHMMAERGIEMVRYADDFVLLCRDQSEAERALAIVQEWAASVGLTLHPDKTRIVDATQRGGFDFLGYHFERGMKWPRVKSIQKLKETIRARTKRANGNSLEQIIIEINRTLRGWFEYFRHSHRTTYRPLDSWIRMRLRSILRKRKGGRGRGRGSDHQRWPNAYFTKQGLYSLEATYAMVCQSSQR